MNKQVTVIIGKVGENCEFRFKFGGNIVGVRRLHEKQRLRAAFFSYFLIKTIQHGILRRLPLHGSSGKPFNCLKI